MKLDLILKSPVPSQAILALQTEIAEWQTDNPDFEEELYQVITFHIIQILINFNLVEFKIWVADINLHQSQYSLTHVLEPLPWTLQAIRENHDFAWSFYDYNSQTNLFFSVQKNGGYLLQVYSDKFNHENLSEILSKQALINILTDLKFTFETYIKQHFSDVLPKNYLVILDNFYDLMW